MDISFCSKVFLYLISRIKNNIKDNIEILSVNFEEDNLLEKEINTCDIVVQDIFDNVYFYNSKEIKVFHVIEVDSKINFKVHFINDDDIFY